MRNEAEQLEAIIATVLATAPGTAWHQPYAPGKWRRIEVLGHLVDSAMNNHQRFVRAWIDDSLEFPGYDPDGWVRAQNLEAYRAESLLQLWVGLNQLIAHVVSRIPDSKRATRCRIGDDPECTLEWLVKDYNRHLLHHLGQIFPAFGLP